MSSMKGLLRDGLLTKRTGSIVKFTIDRYKFFTVGNSFHN